MLALPIALAISPLPLPPITAGCEYKGTQTTTTDENTTTWTGVDIGLPHPKRVIVLACYLGVAAGMTATVNGISQYARIQNTAHECGITLHQVPCGTTANIAVTAASSLRKAVSIYVAYPANHLQLDSGTATANTTADAAVNAMAMQVGGCLIYVGSQNAVLGTFTTTWSGADTITEDVDAQIESTASYTMGAIKTCLRGSSGGNVTLAESTSGTKRLAVVTFGSPYRYMPTGG